MTKGQEIADRMCEQHFKGSLYVDELAQAIDDALYERTRECARVIRETTCTAIMASIHPPRCQCAWLNDPVYSMFRFCPICGKAKQR
jgi:hypothetical protein